MVCSPLPQRQPAVGRWRGAALQPGDKDAAGDRTGHISYGRSQGAKAQQSYWGSSQWPGAVREVRSSAW